MPRNALVQAWLFGHKTSKGYVVLAILLREDDKYGLTNQASRSDYARYADVRAAPRSRS
ncbi:MAG: hypothetical protein AB8G99_22230 [Planctomycetaceae bacterium]